VENKLPYPSQKAREYAFLLLKFRMRSEKELTERLQRKKFSDAVIGETLTFLKEKKFIDDSDFARAWVADRLKKPFGMRRIRQELKSKGIADSIIACRIDEVKKDYCEQELVERIARERFPKIKGVEPQKAKSRLYAYLLRRGFSPDVIMNVVNSCL